MSAWSRIHFFEQRLTTVNVASGDVRQLSPADLYVYEYDWSPDGKRFITTAAHGEGDDNWYIAELYTVDASSGETHSILKPSTPDRGPALVARRQAGRLHRRHHERRGHRER